MPWVVPFLLSYILRDVSFGEVVNVCRVAWREPMHLCTCVSEEGGDEEVNELVCLLWIDEAELMNSVWPFFFPPPFFLSSFWKLLAFLWFASFQFLLLSTCDASDGISHSLHSLWNRQKHGCGVCRRSSGQFDAWQWYAHQHMWRLSMDLLQGRVREEQGQRARCAHTLKPFSWRVLQSNAPCDWKYSSKNKKCSNVLTYCWWLRPQES